MLVRLMSRVRQTMGTLTMAHSQWLNDRDPTLDAVGRIGHRQALEGESLPVSVLNYQYPSECSPAASMSLVNSGSTSETPSGPSSSQERIHLEK